MRRTHQTLPGSLDRDGTVTVEMAFALPILFLVLFAAIDLARLNMIRNSAENAAYEGARRAILPGATPAQVKAAAETSLKAIGAVNPTITITPSNLDPAIRTVSVKIDIPLASNAWTAAAARTTKVLTKSCTMTRERTKTPTR
jgi:Flp pilus assembly protein TadG